MNLPPIPARAQYVMAGATTSVNGVPCELPDTHTSEDRRGNHKRGTHQAPKISQWECSVLVIEPRRRSAETPHAENYKQGLRKTDGLRVCAAAQLGRLPA